MLGGCSNDMGTMEYQEDQADQQRFGRMIQRYKPDQNSEEHGRLKECTVESNSISAVVKSEIKHCRK